MRLGKVPALFLFCVVATDGVVVPSTSLDTLPVVYMGGNAQPRPKENLEMLAKMRYVVIEKWEGRGWDECLANISNSVPCSPLWNEEQDQMATLRAVKAINKDVPGIFYLNTILDFHYLHLHALYEEADALIRNEDGTLCQLINDNGMKNITAFDYAKPVGQQLWLDTIKNLTRTGVVDGFYGDTMQVYAVQNGDKWELCKSSHHTCCVMNETMAQAYNKGKAAVMQQAYDFLGKEAVFFKTSDYLVGAKKLGNNPVAMANAIEKQLAIMPYVHINAGDQKTSHDPSDISSDCSDNVIASFLLGVQPGAFLGCNGWDAQHFGRPLGNPTGPAQTQGKTMWRNFSTGTSVTWDMKKNKGTVHWSGPAPPTPAPGTPRPPPPAPAPTQRCGQMWIGGNNRDDLGQTTAAGWPECCEWCANNTKCAAWTWYSDGTGACHAHGSAAGRNDNAGRVSGVPLR